MSSLGIYFGPRVISVVEAKGKKVLNNIQIPNPTASLSAIEEKIPEEIKIISLLKNKLRENRIESKDATVALSGKDLIIRTFAIPVLPKNELSGAINFEAKKYIPFKLEELVSGFQTQFDKLNNRQLVLFVGIKKEILEKYFSILRQLNIKIRSLEYAAFSMLRLIELTGFKEKGITGVINIDSQEDDEAAFTVTENGFPLFSCDIKIPSLSRDPLRSSENAAAVTEKLKSEIRISLDYYNHKFPIKRIKQMLLIGSPDCYAGIEAFMQELNLPFSFVDPSKIIGKPAFSPEYAQLPMPFSLSFLKAYSSVLSKAIKTIVKINILSAWEKSNKLKSDSGQPKELIPLLLSYFELDPKMAVLAALICSGSFVLGYLQRLPLHKELNAIIASRPATSKANSQADYEELRQIENKYKENLTLMDNLLKNQLYLTPRLSAIPGLIPEGMWLEDFSFANADKKTEFALKGVVYVGNNTREIELINNLLFSLKKHPDFSKYFKEIKIDTINTLTMNDRVVTYFVISGHS